MRNEIAFIASTIKSVAVDVPAGATTELLAAPGEGKCFWIYDWLLGAAAATGTYQLLSAATVKTGSIPAGVNSGSSRGNIIPIFKCAFNEALNITTVGNTIDGVLSYRIMNTD